MSPLRASLRQPRNRSRAIRNATRVSTSSDTLTPTPLLERAMLHAGTLLAGGTGLVLAWMKYLHEAPADEFAIVGHPWQPFTQHAHVVAAPLLIVALGMILRPHVLTRLFDAGFRRARRTGVVLACVVLPMVTSGYLLQVASDEAWRRAWVVIHVVTSLGFLAGTLAHVMAVKKLLMAQRG